MKYDRHVAIAKATEFMVSFSATDSSELWVAEESDINMDFFDRKGEIDYLRKERDLSKKVARMTVVTGRRRVGKTQLIQHAMGDEPYLYFLVTRRAETDQCADFIHAALRAGPGEDGRRGSGATSGISALAISSGGFSSRDPWDPYAPGRVLLDNLVVTLIPSGTYIVR